MTAYGTSLHLTPPQIKIYPRSQGPAYVRGHTIVLGMLCAAWCLTAMNVAYCHYENREKEAGKREQYRGDGSDRDPAFKYVL